MGRSPKPHAPPPHLPLSAGYETSRLEVSTAPAQKRTLHVSATSVFREPRAEPTMTKAMAQIPSVCKRWEDEADFPCKQPSTTTDVGVPISPSLGSLLDETHAILGQGEESSLCDLVASHIPSTGTGEITIDPTRDAEEGLQALRDLGCDMTPHHMFEDPWGDGSMIFSLEQSL